MFIYNMIICTHIYIYISILSIYIYICTPKNRPKTKLDQSDLVFGLV